MAQQDFYEVLGVSKQADDAEINKRSESLQLHPEKFGDANAEQKFKEINEAYDILKDKEKRAAYDQFGHAAFDGTAGQGQEDLLGGFADIEEMFGDFGVVDEAIIVPIGVYSML